MPFNAIWSADTRWSADIYIDAGLMDVGGMQGSMASGDRGNYNEATLAYATLAESANAWLQQLDRLAAKQAGAVFEGLPAGSEAGDLVNEVLDLAPEGMEEQTQFLARKIFFHMFEVVGNR